ncbi:MAG: phosphatase [Bacteroidota bacterium]
MKFAIIDCGTNTFHLMIAETQKDGSVKQIHKSKAVVKLAEGGILKKHINEIPFQRGIKALLSFRKKMDTYGVTKSIAFGTAALRSAKNGKDFINQAWKQSRIKLQLITGSREAALIYKGVLLAIKPETGISLIMDIGGGSTEFILFNEKKLLWKKSFPLGAALLLEMFPSSDPITKSEVKKINAHLSQILQPLFKATEKWKPVRMIGASGSFETFEEIIHVKKSSVEQQNETTSYQFSRSEYNKVHKELMASTTAERINMKGLVKMRVDMIVMATLQLTFVLRKLNVRKMYLSRYALKEGMLSEYIISLRKKN